MKKSNLYRVSTAVIRDRFSNTAAEAVWLSEIRHVSNQESNVPAPKKSLSATQKKESSVPTKAPVEESSAHASGL
jgi:hypothetical protein